MAELYYSKGIQILSTNPYTPKKNSRAERYNRTLLENARAIILHIEKEVWSLAVEAAAYIINRSPIRSNDMKTPHEVYFGKKPNLSNTRVFGCIIWKHVDRPIRTTKLDSIQRT